MLLLADFWSALGGMASVVAAISALVTIGYARATVREARRARKESRDAHEEEITELRSATKAAIAEQRAAAEASAAAHREEMHERDRALRADLTLQRIGQVERISQLLLSLVETAREESINPPPPLSPPMPLRATKVPAMLVRLGVAVSILDSLGGPELLVANKLARQGYGGGSNPMEVVGSGLDALREIDSLVRNHDQLKLDLPASSSTPELESAS